MGFLHFSHGFVLASQALMWIEYCFKGTSKSQY